MTKQTNDLIKSAASGAAAGMLAGYMSKSFMGNGKKIKKKAVKAADTIGSFVDSVADMIK